LPGRRTATPCSRWRPPRLQCSSEEARRLSANYEGDNVNEKQQEKKNHRYQVHPTRAGKDRVLEKAVRHFRLLKRAPASEDATKQAHLQVPSLEPAGSHISTLPVVRPTPVLSRGGRWEWSEFGSAKPARRRLQHVVSGLHRSPYVTPTRESPRLRLGRSYSPCLILGNGKDRCMLRKH